jgi:hypothetical protein
VQTHVYSRVCGIPHDALPPILQMLIAGQFKFMLLRLEIPVPQRQAAQLASGDEADRRRHADGGLGLI